MCRKCGCRSNFGHPVEIQGRFNCDHSTWLWSITLNSKSFNGSFLHLFAWFGGFKRIWKSQEKLEGLMYVPPGQSCKFCRLSCSNICCDYDGLHRSSSIAQALNRRGHKQNLFPTTEWVKPNGLTTKDVVKSTDFLSSLYTSRQNFILHCWLSIFWCHASRKEVSVLVCIWLY